MPRKPTRRRVERAINRLEGDDGQEMGKRTRPRDAKLHVRVDFDTFPLPAEARECVAESVQADHPAPVRRFEDAENAAEALAVPDPGNSVGWDLEAVLDQSADAEEE